MTQTDAILAADGVSLRFDGVRALTDVSFGVRAGEICSVIRPNGAGKTSIVNCISGRYRPTEGLILFQGQDKTKLGPNRRAGLGIGRTLQNLALFEHMNVLDNIMVGRHHVLKAGFLRGIAHRRDVEEIIDFLEIQRVRKAQANSRCWRSVVH